MAEQERSRTSALVGVYADLQQVQNAFAEGQNKTFHPESVVDKIRQNKRKRAQKCCAASQLVMGK